MKVKGNKGPPQLFIGVPYSTPSDKSIVKILLGLHVAD